MDRVRINQVHQYVLHEEDMIEVLYQSENDSETLENITVDSPIWAKKFQDNCRRYDIPVKFTWDLEYQGDPQKFIDQNLSQWNLPEQYVQLDLAAHLFPLCQNDTARKRVEIELNMFAERGMINVLRWLKYFVDTMRENNLVWGVGRGSSVSSYVLYLLGVHKVDSLLYDLPIEEFLK